MLRHGGDGDVVRAANMRRCWKRFSQIHNLTARSQHRHTWTHRHGYLHTTKARKHANLREPDARPFWDEHFARAVALAHRPHRKPLFYGCHDAHFVALNFHIFDGNDSISPLA